MWFQDFKGVLLRQCCVGLMARLDSLETSQKKAQLIFNKWAKAIQSESPSWPGPGREAANCLPATAGIFLHQALNFPEKYVFL